MDDFIEYQRFSDLDDASYLIDLLKQNEIFFKIDDSLLRLNMDTTPFNPIAGGLIIKIRQEDKKKVDQINFKATVNKTIDFDYMYSLSDIDIIDVIVNQEGWTEEELILAKEISEQRNLKPTAKLIKSLQKDKIAINESEQNKQKALIASGSNWFLWIAILSGLNIFPLIFDQNLHSATGLGFNYVVMVLINNMGTSLGVDLKLLGLFLNILILGLFLWIWYKSKNGNKIFYLIGFILYGADTLIYIFTREWFSIVFHFFVLFVIFRGYKALLNSNATTSKTESNKLN